MAINIRCKTCKAEMKLSAKKCHKCGTVIPKKGKLYKVIVRATGKRVTKTTSNLELAREIESRLKLDISRNQFDLKRKKLASKLNEVWAKFLPWAKVHKKSWKDDQYRYEKHLKPVFGETRLDVISPFAIEKLILSLKKGENGRGGNYAPATIKQVVILLSRLYSIADKWGIYSEGNPCHKVKKPKINNQVTEFLTDDELTRLLDTLGNWPNRMTASFVSFLLYTGLRRGELFKLTWKDVDLIQQTIVLRDPKGTQDVNLPLSDKAVDVLKIIPREHKTPFIFYGKAGQQRTDFSGAWKRIKAAAGLPDKFRLHGLRHHYASSLVSAGVDLYVVQKLLTHKDPRMTQRYSHLSNKVLRGAIKLSDKLQSKKQVAAVVELEQLRNG